MYCALLGNWYIIYWLCTTTERVQWLLCSCYNMSKLPIIHNTQIRNQTSFYLMVICFSDANWHSEKDNEETKERTHSKRFFKDFEVPSLEEFILYCEEGSNKVLRIVQSGMMNPANFNSIRIQIASLRSG